MSDTVIQPKQPEIPESAISAPDPAAPQEVSEPTVELRPLNPTVLGLLFVGVLLAGFVGYYGGHASASKVGPAETGEAPKKVEPLNPNEVTLSTAQAAGIKVDAAKERQFSSEKLTTGRIAFNDDKSTPVFSPYGGSKRANTECASGTKACRMGIGWMSARLCTPTHATVAKATLGGMARVSRSTPRAFRSKAWGCRVLTATPGHDARNTFNANGVASPARDSSYFHFLIDAHSQFWHTP